MILNKKSSKARICLTFKPHEKSETLILTNQPITNACIM